VRLTKRGKHKEKVYTEAASRKRLTGAVIAQWVINMALIILICILFGLQQRTSNYLQGRGEFADREREQQRAFICELIGQLHAPEGSELWSLAIKLHCAERPLPPRADAAPQSSPVPIVGDETNSTGTPTPGASRAKATVTGQAGGGNGHVGTKVPAGTAAPTVAPGQQPTPTPTPAPPTSSQPPPEGPGGGLAFCVPLTRICIS
jgi:hypothetical protein